MLIDVVPMREQHLMDAANLAARRFRALRAQISELPAQYSHADLMYDCLAEIQRSAPGVAAIEDGQLVGFLAAWLMPSFRGRPTAYSPEWANGADLTRSRRVYEALYTAMAAKWLESGFNTHFLSILANDTAALNGWHWLGHGLIAIDAIRDLRPVLGQPADVSVRRAGPRDLNTVMELAEALRQHMLGSPIFLPRVELDLGFQEQQLADARVATWLAERHGKAIAFLVQGPANDDACTINKDPGTTGILAAFTRESERGRGIMSLLLNQALSWAIEQGYVRCAVDFEPMNHWAARFWTRHFQPVVYSLGRIVT